MKNLIQFVLGMALLAFVLPVHAQFKETITATRAPAKLVALTTNTAAADVGSPVYMAYAENVLLSTSFYETNNAAATGGNLTFTFARSVDGANWETNPRFTWVLKSNGTNSIEGSRLRAVTNWNCGATRWIKIVSIVSACSNDVAFVDFNFAQSPK